MGNCYSLSHQNWQKTIPIITKRPRDVRWKYILSPSLILDCLPDQFFSKPASWICEVHSLHQLSGIRESYAQPCIRNSSTAFCNYMAHTCQNIFMSFTLTISTNYDLMLAFHLLSTTSSVTRFISSFITMLSVCTTYGQLFHSVPVLHHSVKGSNPCPASHMTASYRICSPSRSQFSSFFPVFFAKCFFSIPAWRAHCNARMGQLPKK